MGQQFSTACSPGCDPGDPGSSPASDSLRGACFSLSHVLSLFLIFPTHFFSFPFYSLSLSFMLGTILEMTDELGLE